MFQRPQCTLSLLWPKPCQSPDGLAGCFARKRKLPIRRMAQLDRLLAHGQGSTASGGQINRPDRHLRRQAKCICCGRTIGHNDLSALLCQCLNCLLNRRTSLSKPRLNRTQINATPGTDELAALRQAREGLIHRSP